MGNLYHSDWSYSKTNFLEITGRLKMKKLKDLLSEVFDETPKVDRHKVIEGVRNYGIVGKQLYNSSNIMEIAKQLAEVAESAHSHILGEQDDWFDKISINKNMKSLKGNVMEFQKTAKEAHALNQRLTGLYEDIGGVLNRYYDIDEVVNEVDKGDMDNDGKDEPDDEEYMDNKDKAIKKAVGETYKNVMKKPTKRLEDITSNVVTLKSLALGKKI